MELLELDNPIKKPPRSDERDGELFCGSAEIDRANAVVIASNLRSFNYTAIADGIVVAINNGLESALTTTVNGVTQSGYCSASFGGGGLRIMAVNVSAGDLISCQSNGDGWNWGAVFYPYK